MPKKETKHFFEQSLKRLEAIVESLEQGDIPLEESLAMYEEGIKLSKECMETLKTADLKIKKLTKDLGGSLQLTEFEE